MSQYLEKLHYEEELDYEIHNQEKKQLPSIGTDEKFSMFNIQTVFISNKSRCLLSIDDVDIIDTKFSKELLIDENDYIDKDTNIFFWRPSLVPRRDMFIIRYAEMIEYTEIIEYAIFPTQYSRPVQLQLFHDLRDIAIHKDHKNNDTYYIENILDRLDSISNRKYNWDDNGSKAVNTLSLNTSKRVLIDIFVNVTEKHNWIEPYISSDEEGDITAKWVNGKKSLYLLIIENDISYLKVWGSDINKEMTDGNIRLENFIKLWRWLING